MRITRGEKCVIRVKMKQKCEQVERNGKRNEEENLTYDMIKKL